MAIAAGNTAYSRAAYGTAGDIYNAFYRLEAVRTAHRAAAGYDGSGDSGLSGSLSTTAYTSSTYYTTAAGQQISFANTIVKLQNVMTDLVRSPWISTNYGTQASIATQNARGATIRAAYLENTIRAIEGISTPCSAYRSGYNASYNASHRSSYTSDYRARYNSSYNSSANRGFK